MKIRSITYFDSINWPFDRDQVQTSGKFIEAAKDEYQEQGFEVQTTRLASVPFPTILGETGIDQAVEYAVSLEEEMLNSGFDYASIGPAVPEFPESYQVIPDVLSNTESIFCAGIICAPGVGIDLAAIRQCAEVIKKNSTISDNGFGNLRFAALANVSPGSPFLPAAYMRIGSGPGFAIATEAADLSVEIFNQCGSLEKCRRELISSIEQHANNLGKIGEKLAAMHNVQFMGVDFSLAPFPSRDQSIGTAVEQLGSIRIGNHGSLAAVAILADAVDQAQYPKAGFNGIMLPVLEDTVLAGGAVADMLTINKLLLYSTVCGTGLDTLPLAGSVTKDQLYAVLLDLAVLAQRLDKPLTARLMPIPGKEAGDQTAFDFEFFANSKIMQIDAEPLSGRLVQESNFSISPRGSYRKSVSKE